MATFSAALRHVKEHVDALVPEDEVLRVCRDVGHRWRDRRLGPAASVHLLLLQLLAGVSLRGVRRVAGVAASAQAVCAARARLPVQLWMRLVERSVPAGAAAAAAAATFHGLRVFLADGMSFATEDTPALAARHGRGANQRGPGRGRPVPKLLALLDLDGGFVRRVVTLPWCRHECACLARLFAAVGGAGAVLLGDRGLVGFAHLALLAATGADGCFRLPRRLVVRGRGRGARRRVRALGRQDVLVRWRAPDARPPWLSRRRWAAAVRGRALVLRQVAFRVRRRGFRTRWAWLVTTLTDPARYPAQDLVDLYAKRWRVEVCFRDLKRTLGMSLVSARTVAGARKEVLAFVVLYNLVRRVMADAARRQGVDADRVSFADAARWLLWSAPGGPPPVLAVNPARVRPAQPRRVKPAGFRFPPLNTPRAGLVKPAYEATL